MSVSPSAVERIVLTVNPDDCGGGRIRAVCRIGNQHHAAVFDASPSR